MNTENNSEIIPNSYIIVFNPTAASQVCESHLSWADDLHSNRISVLSDDSEFKSLEGIKHHYKVSQHDGWLGYAGQFDAATVEEIAARDEVAFVEPDRKVYTKDYVTEPAVSWGLARISQRTTLTSDAKPDTYSFDKSAGSGVTAYVIDTGVFAEHEDFEGRATLGFNSVAGSSNTDKNGHGTHVSGTIAGKKNGIAKKAKIIGVKVLGDTGEGSNSTVIAGLDWAVQHAQTNGTLKTSVANMSLGGSYSAALNSAVKSVISKGLTVCVAAGNESQDAATSSPASEPSAITVGATTIDDNMSTFSNFGTLVDIFAPGTNITSAWIDPAGKKTTLTKTISGTSMATPHVTGLAAYFISLEGLSSPAKIRARLTQLAGKNQIKGLLGNSPNLLAYNGSENTTTSEL